MSDYWIDKPDQTIQKIVSATFPSYKGRKFRLSTNIPSRIDSYWSGGSRDSFVFYELNSGQVLDVHSNHPIFEAGRPRDLESLPAGVVLVKRSIFCGKDMGIVIYANINDLTPMIPAKVELSENEKIVLQHTKSLKSSYAGIKNYRFHEAHRKTKITIEEWDEAKQSLINRKLLNRAGAITASGRNAIR